MTTVLPAPASADVHTRVDLVVPKPQSVEVLEGAFTWTQPQPVQLDETSRADAFAARLLAAAVAERGLPAWSPGHVQGRIVIGQRHRALAVHDALGGHVPPYLGDDGYLVRVTADGVVVLGETAAGVYYGVQTLIALLPEDGSGAIGAVEIRDTPGLKVRGFMQDYGRRQVPTLATLKRTIVRMGELKLNMFFPYFEDAFAFASHPEIGADRDRFTPDEMRELVAFAVDHHVRIVPIFQGLGHLNDILSTPGLEHLRDADGTDVLNPVDPAATTLLEDLIADACAVFPDPLFHVGLDETFGLGTGGSRPVAETYGAGTLFAGQVHRLHEILERHQKRMILWTDQIEPGFFKAFGLPSLAEALTDQLPRDAVLSSWHYGDEQEWPGGELFAQLGFDQILWGAVGHCLELVPNLVSTARNAASYLRFAHEMQTLGGCVSQWEDVYENVPFDLSWPGLAYFAECLWHAEPRDWQQVLDSWLARQLGAAGAAVSDAFRTLGELGEVVDWGGVPMRSPSAVQLARPPEPLAMSAEQLQRLDAVAIALDDTAAAFEAVQGQLRRGQDLLDLEKFALLQAQVLVATMRYRHELATGATPDATTDATTDSLLDAAPIVAGFERIVATYREIWARDNKPLNLDRSARRFETMLAHWRTASALVE
jgi:hypothetical protein